MKVLKSAGLNAFGGINFIYEYLDKLGLDKIFLKELPKLAPQSQYSWKDISYALFSVFFCGGNCIEDIQDNLKQHIGNNPYCKIPSPDRLLSRLKDLSEEVHVCKTKRGQALHSYSLNNALGNLNIQVLKKMGVFDSQVLTLDYDNTIIFTEKDDSKMTYKRAYGYQPGVCTLNTEQVVYLENRNGNSDARSFQQDTLGRMFDLFEDNNLPKMDNFRADAASYLYDVIRLVDQKVKHFFISANNRYVFKYFKQIDTWTETLDEKGEVIYIGDIKYTPFEEPAKKNKKKAKPYRLVVKKKLRKDGQYNIETMDAFEYRAIITNNYNLRNEEVICFYNQRGKMERQFDVLKNDFGWNNMPFSKLNHNTVFLYYMAICKNIYSKLIVYFSKKVKGLKPNHRIKRFIFKVVILPTKWVYKSRQKMLRVFGETRLVT